MSFASAQRDWETPPDEPEAKLCEDCGKELDEDGFCTNVWCPARFIPSSKYSGELLIDLAEHIVELEEKLESTQSTLKYVRRKLAWYDETIKHNLEVVVERIETEIAEMVAELTPSQSDVVVRDTDYAIRRMEDAIEYAECEHDPDFQVLRKEWNEVKKILMNL